MQEKFRKASMRIASVVGSPWHFCLWLFLTFVWLASGPFMGFSEEWNFWANTTTTVFTFLIAILLQNTQERNSKEIQLKLDEIIRAIEDADNDFIDLERLSEQDLKRFEQRLKKFRSK